MADSEKYGKLTQREHILLRPDTYIGPTAPREEEMFIYEDGKITNKNIIYSPGFFKIFDEILVNARDASINDTTLDTIKVNYNIEEGYISVYNNGDNGIPVEEHPIHKILTPSLIFGELLTSSNYNDNEERVTGGRNGYGSKCLSPHSILQLYNGNEVLAKDIKIDDILIGDDGTPRKVINIITGNGQMYEVSQSLGEKYIVNDEHILTLHMPDHKVIFWNSDKQGWTVLWWNNDKKKINSKSISVYKPQIVCPECNITLSGNLNRHYRRQHKNIDIPKKERKSPTINPEINDDIMKGKLELEEFCKTIDDNNVFDISIKDYMKLDKTTQGRLAGVRGQCIQWSKKEVELDAYILGLWLGDGFQTGYGFAMNPKDDPEIMDYISKWCENNDAQIRQTRKYSYSISSKSNYGKRGYAPLKNLLKIYNLINNKHIPKEYLINDRDTRLKVLAGLIDTDGNVVREGTRVVITQGMMHEVLAKNIIYLSRSLGFCCQYYIRKTSWTWKGEKKKGLAYNINISGEGIKDIPTLLPRKKCASPKTHNTSKSTGIIKIKDNGINDYVGIKIDGNERFLINDFTVTHNCSNIFSTRFILEIDDAKRNKRFHQEWTDNMLNASVAQVTKLPSKMKSSIKITFYPDLKKFGLKDLNNTHLNLFHRRAIDMAGVATNKLKVFFNDEKIEVNNFKNYIELYHSNVELYYDTCDRWSVGVIYKPDSSEQVISFVNSISTYRGGTHCNHVIDNIVKQLLNDYIKKKDKDIKVTLTQVKENFIFFINCVIINPSFASQTKDTLTTKVDKFGSKYEPSQAFIKKLSKCGIVEQIVSLAKFKEKSNLKKTDGKKQVKITGIPKLEDANKAGTKESNKCTLILTEGDSAKATAMAGISVTGRDYYGVFPLKGKLLNVRDAPPTQLLNNEEITHLKTIIGLKQGEDYSNDEKFNNLRYGHIILLTDADTDGFHIKGLFINMVHSLWPSLVKRPEFIESLMTPIVKAFKNKETLTFYNLTDYDIWKELPEAKAFKVKYYKGLGTSTSLEAKEYFTDVNNKLIKYTFNNNNNDEAIRLAFDKSRADDRKVWLMSYDKNRMLNYKDKEVEYYDFIHSELIHFSNDDLNRSIPSVIDGLKPSQRKILFGAFLRGLDKDEVKVAQLAGFVSDKAAYHHGEMSLNGAIIGMAQNFVGSNNINILKPNGQFGTRLKGNDAASPRYIWTKLEITTPIIFNANDNNILQNQIEDGMQIEPEFYIPIIPMVLINGTQGIGTGFSTKIPPYNPREVINNLKKLLNNQKMKSMRPWWQGFTGTITKVDNYNYEIRGVYEIENNKLIITELPVGEWTSNYKELLENILEKKKDSKAGLLDYKDNNTDQRVYFELTFEDGYLDDNDKIEKEYHLVKKYSITNMHLYSPKGSIKKYDTVYDIIDDYYNVRLELYQKRKDYQLDVLKNQLEMISYKVKFILLVIDKKINVNNRKKSEIETDLESHDFPRIKNNFDYLLSMPIYNLTFEKVEELKKQKQDKEIEYNELKDKTINNMWMEELEKLEQVLDVFEEQRESERSDSKPVKTKKVKK